MIVRVGLGRFGLGAMSYQQAVAILGNAAGYTDAQVQEAWHVVYPATDASGGAISQTAIDQGAYVQTDEGYQIAGGSGGGNCGPAPKPTSMPPLYPAEYCVNNGIPDAECVARNMQRQQANLALHDNWIAEQDRAICEHNNCLNSGHLPPTNCAAEFPMRPVPSAPGSPVLTAADQYGIQRPTDIAAPGTKYTASQPGSSAVANQPAGAAPSDQSNVVTVTPEVVSESQSQVASQFPGFISQIQQGGSELLGSLSEQTGMSSNILLLAAAGIGAYLLFVKK